MNTADRHVFVSYSHADAAWIARLKIHLRPLVRQGALDLWDDSKISPGQSWHEEIAKALARARIAILLVSADFLASDFVVNSELPPLLHRAASGGVLIVPLVIGPCLFSEHAELSRYQAVNSPDRPLSLIPAADAEEVLLSLARSVDQYFRLIDASLLHRPDASKPLVPRGEASASSKISASGETFRRVVPSDWPESSPYGPLVVARPLNLSFDGSAPNGIPVGWFNSFGHVTGVSTDYGIRVCRRSANSTDGTCAVLEKISSRPREFGSLMQRCRGRFLAGKTIRLEGELRTENVTGWAGIWLRADADAEPNLFFDNMAGRPVVGTTSWTHYFIDAPLPENTDWLNYGIVLSGAGEVYADNFRLLAWTLDGRWENV